MGQHVKHEDGEIGEAGEAAGAGGEEGAYAWLEPALFSHTTPQGAELAERWFSAARTVDDLASEVSRGDAEKSVLESAAAALAGVEDELREYYEAHRDEYEITPQ